MRPLHLKLQDRKDQEIFETKSLFIEAQKRKMNEFLAYTKPCIESMFPRIYNHKIA